MTAKGVFLGWVGYSLTLMFIPRAQKGGGDLNRRKQYRKRKDGRHN